ncbi:G-type lectin S-receptor-like serine/threonine-protein kinase LECRK3 isoform X2 [Argentina anserina]|uniref:G-type lectin S-receptor-like serine/threonine-protein kinase LECRK3 isoform X2 n=1 Tax=Argentina anserina TaxID=57926 RepID=UPI0021764440|nr:G-type lectin S-receptor-like serine/threonine-protein kinase LECRK3 isoform X2 [Potentilla anserina]
MAFLAACLLAFAVFFNAQARLVPSNISRGSSLTPHSNSSWLSSSGVYAFGFYKQGNGYAVGIVLVGIPEKIVVWTANRDDPLVSDNATLLLTADGLSLKPTQGQPMVASTTQAVFSASMLDSGSQLYSAKSETNSSTGIFRLIMQKDGNLVQYPVATSDPYYATGTDGSGNNVTLNLDADGHLYLVNNTVTIFNITNGGITTDQSKSYLMRLDIDGIFRLYSYSLKQNGNWSVEWQSTLDKCNPLGVCGFNSYCVTMDLKAECKCLPGFEPTTLGDQTSGCGRNTVADVCNSVNESFTYIMQELPSTRWDNFAYMTLSLSDKEECNKACLEDCNCEAALFVGGSCRMQRLPLSYGRRRLDTSDSAFIKVGISKPPAADNFLKDKNKRKGLVAVLILGVLLTAFGTSLLVISVFAFWKPKVWGYKMMNQLNGDVEWNEDEVAPRPYAYEQLEKMTDNFKEEVGRGASATVYKGVMLCSHKLVAVKKLENVAAEGEKEFQTEMKVIGRTHHRSLVRLLGYCHDGPKKLLVYEYMRNGSLADILFTPKRKLYWEERMGIARNIARGLLYLHEDCDTQIIHCDIKPQNILMDEYMCPKIADFGLAKLLQQDQTRTTTGIRGTKGYVAPEWHRKMPITVKADVYSFGIVLLEIVCCRRNVDWSLPQEEAILDELVYHYFESGELSKLIRDEEINVRQFERVIKVALWCMQDEPSLRPSMKKVLLMLEGTVDIPIPPNPSSFLNSI